MGETNFVFRIYGSDGKFLKSFFFDHKKMVEYFLKNKRSISRVVLFFSEYDVYSMDREEFSSDFLKSMTPCGEELKLPPPKEFVGNFLFTRSHQLLGMG